MAAPVPNLTNMVATVRNWTNVRSTARLPDSTVISWIRMAEERINEELRCTEMVRTVQGNFTANGQTLPDDFLEANYVRSVAAPYVSYKNCTPEEYYRQLNSVYAGVVSSPLPTPLPAAASPPYMYAIVGNALLVAPAADPNLGTLVELNYMARLQPLNDDVVNPDGSVTVNNNWLNARYTRLYTFASLALSAPFLVEDDRYTMWESEATRLISGMNMRYTMSRRGKGPIKTNFRSFG